MKRNGFTPLELLIALAFVGIIGAIIFGGSLDTHQCHAGYEWVMDANGTLHQVIGDDGRPVKCTK